MFCLCLRVAVFVCAVDLCLCLVCDLLRNVGWSVVVFFVVCVCVLKFNVFVNFLCGLWCDGVWSAVVGVVIVFVMYVYVWFVCD